MNFTHQLSDTGRRALDNFFNTVAQINGTSDAGRLFNVNPSTEQVLRDVMQESVEFLGMVNIAPVNQLLGAILGLGVPGLVGGRTAAADLPRRPGYAGAMQGRNYQLYEAEYDTKLPWALIDQWAEFPDFATRYSRFVAQAIGLTRIAVGWHGVEAAETTDPVAHPLRQDMNIGWLQKLRLERADHVMGRATVVAGGVTTATGAAVPIEVGAGADTYKNLDALVFDLISGLPSWARNSTELRVCVSADLLDEKLFPQINRPLGATIDGGKATTDEVVGTVIQTPHKLGNRPALIVPYFPEGTVFVSPTKNLSIYEQKGSRRRFIRDEPENKAALVDYNSVNDGYVIEDTDFAALAENITFVE